MPFIEGEIRGALSASLKKAKTRSGGAEIHSVISNPDILFSLLKLTRSGLFFVRLDGQVDIRKMDADIVFHVRIAINLKRCLLPEPIFSVCHQRVIDVQVRFRKILE